MTQVSCGVVWACFLAVLAPAVAAAQEAPPRRKPGSCDVKIGTKGLEMFSKIDGKATDAEKQAVAIFNQGIVEYVTAYQQGARTRWATCSTRSRRSPAPRSGTGSRQA